MSTTPPPIEEQVRALEQGRAFVDRSAFRLLAVAGDDALTWLNDLVTAGVEQLGDSRAIRSLLLTPTGRIRADFHIVRTGETELLLIQDPSQPVALDEILAPYVLSSRVDLRAAEDLIVLCLPGRDRAPNDLPAFRPSMLGEGLDVLLSRARLDEARAALDAELEEAGEAAVDAWRIRRGLARFGPDLDENSLPAEAGLETLIDFTKGCFLGQESIAKIRNLGHPPRVVLALRASGPVRAGEAVLAGGIEVGRVTSVSTIGSATTLIALVTWDARSAELSTASDGALIRSD